MSKSSVGWMDGRMDGNVEKCSRLGRGRRIFHNMGVILAIKLEMNVKMGKLNTLWDFSSKLSSAKFFR